VTFTSRDPKHAQEAAMEAGHGAKASTLADLVVNSEIILVTLALPRSGAGA
jgi:hypothetical protein